MIWLKKYIIQIKQYNVLHKFISFSKYIQRSGGQYIQKNTNEKESM